MKTGDCKCIHRIGGTALALCALGGLAAIAAVGVVVIRKSERNAALHTITEIGLARLREEIVNYQLHYGRLPGRTRDEVLETFSDELYNDAFQGPAYEFARRGFDAWGHPIVVKQLTQPDRLILRSLGADGEDDAGRDDDICLVVYVLYVRGENTGPAKRSEQ